jgi:uncharacterized protein with FMN-binding domain
MAKEKIDWEAIQIEYAKGTRSNVDIAVQFGVSEGAIRKKAREKNWAKDLTAQIRIKAAQKVREAEYEASTSYKDARTNAVEIEAEKQADITLKHRSDIRLHMQLRNSLLNECMVQSEQIDDLERLAEIIDSGDDDRMTQAFRKATSLPQRVDTFKKLVESTKTLVGLEREAYGISDKLDLSGNVKLVLDQFDAKL